ncbi:hypothetical protein FB451DRAFT_1557489, partial [Mycena latifolia]
SCTNSPQNIIIRQHHVPNPHTNVRFTHVYPPIIFDLQPFAASHTPRALRIYAVSVVRASLPQYPRQRPHRANRWEPPPPETEQRSIPRLPRASRLRYAGRESSFWQHIWRVHPLPPQV